MEAFLLLTVIYYNLIYVCVKQAWLYNVSCIKSCDLNCCIVIVVTLKKKKVNVIQKANWRPLQIYVCIYVCSILMGKDEKPCEVELSSMSTQSSVSSNSKSSNDGVF